MSTHIRGTLMVTNPSEEVLAELFALFVADPKEHEPAAMARVVMESLGRPVSHQIGPGLVADTDGGERVVKLKVERFYRSR